jgi:hypothetical protein
MSFYVVFANWSDVDTDEMHMFKTLMYMLLVVLLLPALYQARASLSHSRERPPSHARAFPTDDAHHADVHRSL